MAVTGAYLAQPTRMALTARELTATTSDWSHHHNGDHTHVGHPVIIGCLAVA
jgi:hypothetical protein